MLPKYQEEAIVDLFSVEKSGLVTGYSQRRDLVSSYDVTATGGKLFFFEMRTPDYCRDQEVGKEALKRCGELDAVCVQ